ncbi:hypothetical protein LCGC14_0709470 [marine sediment metagenome]|uniref:Uncharacterized protein n=1 Tax=marine sediment metagenome TaxID=412755 RepID=A0A0F9QFI8_9ZZZZ
MTGWQTKQLANTFVDPHCIVQHHNITAAISGVGNHSVWLLHIGVKVGCLTAVSIPITWVLHGVWDNRLQR